MSSGGFTHSQNFTLAIITILIWGFCGIIITAMREVLGTFNSVKSDYAIIIGSTVVIIYWGLGFRGAFLSRTNHNK
jgi:hypothetical protein